MSGDISVGAISASVELRLDQLEAGLKVATGLVTQLGNTLETGLGAILTAVEAKLGQAGAAAQQMGEKLSASANEATTQANRFNETLAATEAKLQALKGVDPLAELRQQFKGLLRKSIQRAKI